MKLEERFWSKVNRRGPEECWEWKAYRNPNGYGQFRIGPRSGGKVFLAHRVSYAMAAGVAPESISLHVCHRCDNPACVNPGHLFLGTAADNIHDMMVKGRYGKREWARGVAHPMAKLTVEQVRAIRGSSGDQRETARMFGCSQGTVHLIRAGKIWRHVS